MKHVATLVATIVATILVAVACTVTTPSPQIIYVTPEPSPIMTAQPTVAPTPTPTLRPTLQPTPRPTPRPIPTRHPGADRYLAFLGHWAMTTEDFLTYSEPLSDALSYTDIGSIVTNAVGLEVWGEGEQIWLSDNRPHACYSTIWEKAYDLARRTERWSGRLSSWALEFPWGSEAEGNAILRDMKEANSLIEEITILIGREPCT